MQRFAGLNSIEGWNLTLQLSIERKGVKRMVGEVDGGVRKKV